MNDNEIIDKFKREHILDFKKTTINEAREKRTKSTETYDEYPCIIEKKEFKLNSEKYDLGTIQVIFFYPTGFNSNGNIGGDGYKYNTIYYIHGGGWCLGGGNHKLPRELCFKSNSLVVYPIYSKSPEVKFPIAIEECFSLLCILEKESTKYNINFDTLIVGGDSAGGNITIALSLLSLERNGPKFKKQFLINPATDVDFKKESYIKYGMGGFPLVLETVIFFYNQYLDFNKDTNNILACPLKATLDQLRGLPETLLILPECDSLYSEGLEFYEKLKSAGVKCLCKVYQGAVHSFVTYKQLMDTTSSINAVNDILNFIKESNQLKHK